MSVMMRFTARSLKKNRVRTVVSVIGIALSCALIMAVFTSVASIQSALYDRTLETEGSWHVYIPSLPEEALSTFEQSEQVSDLAVARDIGAARLSTQDQSTLGDFVYVRTLPQATKGTLEPNGTPIASMPEVKEGRPPQTNGEVMLPYYCKDETLGDDTKEAGATSDGPIALGSTLTLDLGTRKAENSNGETVALRSADIYRSPDAGTNPTEERLENISRKTYTVTGFYESKQHFYGGEFATAASSIVAVANPNEQPEVMKHGDQI